MHDSLRPPRAGNRWSALMIAAVLGVASLAAADEPAPKPEAGRLPTPQEMAASLRDVWGEAAAAQPDGPSYEFFKDLLPPLRYVNTEFRHYPIELSAPLAAVKTRWVSNGSAVNARANKPPMWKEPGTPVHFFIGEPAAPFGHEVPSLDGPRYAEGYLPIVQVADRRPEARYEQEAFAAARGPFADHGTAFLKFSVPDHSGTIVARIAHDPPLEDRGGAIVDAQGRTLVMHDAAWTWQRDRNELHARLEPGRNAYLAVPTSPMPAATAPLTEATYQQERQACAQVWKELLGRGVALMVPEPRVQDAWRALVIGNFMTAVGDRMHYSAGNAYDHLYESECGDATRSLLLFGHTDQARRMVGPLLDFHRQNTRYHVAGHKLQLLSQVYWVVRSTDQVRAWEPKWKPVVDLIVRERRPQHGLLPPDRYAGDISQEVYALNSNSACWRGLRDMAAVVDDLGDHQRAAALTRTADAYRKAILAAVAKSEQRDVDPPFIPNALFGVEKAYPTLTATRFGSYYDLMAPYIIGSGVFPPGSERETWMIRYLQEHGGIAMGMIRSMPHQGQFKGEPGVNVLYGLRYMLALLRRDDRGRALTGFYGQLAQAVTRETYIGGEGSRFLRGDRYGRAFYLPPNSASNAMFLLTLRYLLVQDWDLDDDGRPETLRLLYGAPARWLRDGAVLELKRAPTMFGPVSFRVESQLRHGDILLEAEAPPHKPRNWLVRIPLPAGWKAVTAVYNNAEVPLSPDGKIDLSALAGRVSVRVRVKQAE